MISLKPCPFCSGNDIQSDGETAETSYIYCQSCGEGEI